MAQKEERWKDIKYLLTRPSDKFAPRPFEPSEEAFEMLSEDFRIGLIGCGRLGCEVLKCLAMTGFQFRKPSPSVCTLYGPHENKKVQKSKPT